MVHTERKKERKWLLENLFFFERTALDECVSINIAENTRLRPWEAIGRETEKKRKKKATILTRLDWDINAGYHSYPPNGVSPTHEDDSGEKRTASPTHVPHPCSHRDSDVIRRW